MGECCLNSLYLFAKRIVRRALRLEAGGGSCCQKEKRGDTGPCRPMVFLGNNRALTKTIFGHKIIVDARDVSLAPHILLDGYWERWITNVFLELIEPGMVVVDIGANVGYYSLLAAEKVGDRGRVVCFEANPELADIAFQNLQINGFGQRSEVVNKAVYSEDTTLSFNLYENFLGSSSLFVNEDQLQNYREKVRKIDVIGIKLDSHFRLGEKVDFIKIDAEGAEPFILRGAVRTLRDNPSLKVMLEFSPEIIKGAYGSVKDFYREILGLGFAIYKIEHDSTLTILTSEAAANTQHCDVILKRSAPSGV